MQQIRLKLGKKKQKRNGLISAYAQPTGQFWKRLAAKKVRKHINVQKGNMYKKLWGPFLWS